MELEIPWGEPVTKNECLYALQEGGLDLKESDLVYNYFIEKGIDFLMLEFILATQQDDPRRFGDVVCEIEEEK